MARVAGFLWEWPRDPDPQQAWWAGHGWQEGRKPLAESMLPSFSPPLPRVLHPRAPYIVVLHPCLPHLDAMPCPCALAPALALPAILLCLPAPAPLLAQTPPHATQILFFPVPTWKSYRVLT